MSFDPQNYYWKRGSIGPPRKYLRRDRDHEVPQIIRSYQQRRELKGADQQLSESDIISTTNTSTSSRIMNNIPEGVASYQRVGRKIHLHSLRIRGSLECHYEGTGTNVEGFLVRMVLVWDKQYGNGIPDFDELFGSQTSQGTATTYGIWDNLKYSVTGRFSIVRDVVYNCNPPGLLRGDGVATIKHVPVDEYIPLKGRETIFDGPGHVDISSGGLQLWWRSTVDDSQFHVNFRNTVCRLRYYDQ